MVNLEAKNNSLGSAWQIFIVNASNYDNTVNEKYCQLLISATDLLPFVIAQGGEPVTSKTSHQRFTVCCGQNLEDKD